MNMPDSDLDSIMLLQVVHEEWAILWTLNEVS